MNWTAIGLFLLAAVALLGSPGPGIAALLAVTRGEGLRAGLRYYAGLQVGLALAAAISAAGLFSLLGAFPTLLRAASIVAVLYLVTLAWKIGRGRSQRQADRHRAPHHSAASCSARPTQRPISPSPR